MTQKIAPDLLQAITNRQPVAGLVHNFYRYPARFSPLLARAIIKAFTKPGELVLDPFMGSGTTLVEARALGRRAIGTDISSLAAFVSQVKTAVLSKPDVLALRQWAGKLELKLNLHKEAQRPWEWIAEGYQRNISNKHTWPIRKLLELTLQHIARLQRPRQRQFARCVLLRTAQWALDCRKELPAAHEFRFQFQIYFEEMLAGAEEYANLVRDRDKRHALKGTFRIYCLNRSAIGLEDDPRIMENPAPKLILTSPPYPGVHVIYHRWQVRGRKETPAPFWIADSWDGNGASFYTFGDRHQQNLANYYAQLQDAFTSIAKIAKRKTVVVQLVAFSDPNEQLARYLKTMKHAGFEEMKLVTPISSKDGRLWRDVPNRKWYADQRGSISASKEVVLFHRLA